MRLDWDLIALVLASLAVLLRMLELNRASGIASSFTLLAASIGARQAHRRQLRRDLAEARRAAAAGRPAD